MKTNPAPTQPANDNPLLGGLKQLVREAVKEELESTLLNQKQETEKFLLDTDEAAEFLNVPATWLASMAREGKIKSIKLGHYVRFARADLEAFVAHAKGESTQEKGPVNR